MGFIANSLEPEFNVNSLPAGTYYILPDTGEVFDTQVSAEEACFPKDLVVTPSPQRVNESDEDYLERVEHNPRKHDVFGVFEFNGCYYNAYGKPVRCYKKGPFRYTIRYDLEPIYQYRECVVAPYLVTIQRSFYRDWYSVNICKDFDSIPPGWMILSEFPDITECATKEEAIETAKEYAKRLSILKPDGVVEIETDTAEWGGGEIAGFQNGVELEDWD